SPFHDVDLVDIQRLLVPEERNDDRQADGRLGRRHRHHKEDEDLARAVAEERREGDQREVDRIQHQLDTHEDDDRVPPCEHADDPDREENGADREVVIQRDEGHGEVPFRFASTITPTIAATRRSETTSKGKRKSVKSTFPTDWAVPSPAIAA